MTSRETNLDRATVTGFGAEWTRFDQAELSETELRSIFEQYFSEFPWKLLPASAEGFDLGCGSGRWAKFVAPRVGTLHCIDAAAAALEVARRSLASYSNCAFHLASVDAIPLEDASMDFGYSLGVLHHVPDTLAGIEACARKLRPGAPFLLYLYYAFDNRPAWFRLLWRASDLGRRLLSRLPFRLRALACDAIALTTYWPLARLARMAQRAGHNVEAWPLSAYRDRSLYVMRTDALDRFGTRLEQRFTRDQIRAMLEKAGFTDIRFRDGEPYWCAVGVKEG
jgi:ubiquinone/menaquinone biosynthesis C-methylase UbiE